MPQRLIDAGTFNGQPFGRFDAVDRTNGGDTSRRSLSAEWHDRGERGHTRVAGYAMRYRLDLNSDFTYALNNPVDGDQFKQTDRRTVYGLNAVRSFHHALAGWDARSDIGLQLRHDRSRVGLYDTVARSITATTREDEVRLTQLGLYGQTALQFTPLLCGIFGLRADRQDNRVDALTLPENGGSASATLVSPKLTLVAGPYEETEFVFNAGRGMHSNDARGTTITRDPKTGNPADKVPALVASRGCKNGVRTEALPGVQSSLAIWKLDFDSELVYVGHAGATEASAASTRRGVELKTAACRWRGSCWTHRGQQRALRACHHHQPAPGAQVRQQRRADAGCLQSPRPQGQRHPVLL